MKDNLHTVCLLLGSNIQPEQNLLRAAALLHQYFPILGVSSVWQSAAIGSDGPDFLNAAVVVQVVCSRGTLKEQFLRPIETSLGRVRTADKNAPRTMDLDILMWDGSLLDENLWRFAHLAVPAAEVLPALGAVRKSAAIHAAAERLQQLAPIHKRMDMTIELGMALPLMRSTYSLPVSS